MTRFALERRMMLEAVSTTVMAAADDAACLTGKAAIVPL